MMTRKEEADLKRAHEALSQAYRATSRAETVLRRMVATPDALFGQRSSLVSAAERVTTADTKLRQVVQMMEDDFLL